MISEYSERERDTERQRDNETAAHRDNEVGSDNYKIDNGDALS